MEVKYADIKRYERIGYRRLCQMVHHRDGNHIGWICSYTDLDYMENIENVLAIGLDIPSMENRKNGCGTIVRTTSLIDENGFIEQIFLPKQIKTRTHAEQLLG